VCTGDCSDIEGDSDDDSSEETKVTVCPKPDSLLQLDLPAAHASTSMQEQQTSLTEDQPISHTADQPSRTVNRKMKKATCQQAADRDYEPLAEKHGKGSR
jgi:hypothetical protein